MKRSMQIAQSIMFVQRTEDALDEMSRNSNIPTDLGEFPIGTLEILKSLGVTVIISNDDVFGIMTLPESEEA